MRVDAEVLELGVVGSSASMEEHVTESLRTARQPVEAVPGRRQDRKRRRPRVVRTVVDWLVFIAVCTGLWLVAGPAQLGGPAHYVIVDGPSMEPTYRDGDLVVARAQESYAVGEVVTYQPDIGQPFPVIHRIVDVTSEGRYITQGDNRAEVDGWFATEENIFGASWLHVPYGGKVLMLVREPALWLALAAGFFALGFLTRDKGKRRHERKRRRRKAEPSAGSVERVPSALMVLVLPVFFIGAAFAAYLVVDGGVLQAWTFDVNAPVADAGEDQTVEVGETVTLDGTDSYDPDGDPLTYSWELATPNGSTAELDDPASATPNLTPDVVGDYIATLTVTDSSGLSDSDTVTITATQP